MTRYAVLLCAAWLALVAASAFNDELDVSPPGKRLSLMDLAGASEEVNKVLSWPVGGLY